MPNGAPHAPERATRTPFWTTPTGLVTAGALLLAVAAAAALIFAFSGEDDAPPAGGAPGTAASVPVGPAASTDDPVGGVLLWNDQVMLDRAGLELDEGAPRRGTGDGDSGDIYTNSWTQVSTRNDARIALWTQARAPSAADCLAAAASSGGTSAPAETGRLFCVESSDGRAARVKLVNKSPFGSFGWITQATVWERPQDQ